jgi:hypothetical protein
MSRSVGEVPSRKHNMTLHYNASWMIYHRAKHIYITPLHAKSEYTYVAYTDKQSTCIPSGYSTANIYKT